MRTELLDFLACPSCGGDLRLTPVEEHDGDVVSGTLECSGCGAHYLVAGGVPRMNEATQGLERVADAFSFEWKAHLDGQLESDTIFGRTKQEEWEYFNEATGYADRELAGKLVLDAGCGPAQVTRLMSEHGARVAIGMDFNEAVDEAYRACRDLPHVHIVQGNVFAPPFKKHVFDLVWSNGVIHHTPDARGAHKSLSRLVKPGGMLYVWVYPDRLNPFRLTKDILDFLRVTRLPKPVLMQVATAFSYVSLALLRAYQLVRLIPGLQPTTRWGRRTVRDRSLQELRLTWFDSLSPQFNSRHTNAQVMGWFKSLGFRDIHAIDEPKVGVRGIAPATDGAKS
jgi:SAM-dependent methyltransferase/uncharacterized protein YbaR (Trm112 family)